MAKGLVLCNLKGGLGNQMFQYASARGCFSEEYIVFDHIFLNKYNKSSETFTARKFELDIFKNLRTKKINYLLLTLITSKNFSMRLLRKILSVNVRIIADSDKCDQVSISGNEHKFKYIEGYFQSEEYFKHIRQELLEEFRFPELPQAAGSLLHQITASNNSVAIHVRRGDYLKSANLNYHGVLDIDYYINSIQLLEKKMSNLNYFVFSDDISWCQTNLLSLSPKITIISTGQDAWVDMCLMSRCSCQIIANSSFSWWAAWLNQSDQKIIIAPKNWFVNPPDPIFSNLIPDNWITI